MKAENASYRDVLQYCPAKAMQKCRLIIVHPSLLGYHPTWQILVSIPTLALHQDVWTIVGFYPSISRILPFDLPVLYKEISSTQFSQGGRGPGLPERSHWDSTQGISQVFNWQRNLIKRGFLRAGFDLFVFNHAWHCFSGRKWCCSEKLYENPTKESIQRYLGYQRNQQVSTMQ